MTLRPRHCPAFASLSSTEEVALLDAARTLQRAAAAGRAQALLRGKNLGLLCHDDTQPEAMLFRRAATDLGAHVAHVAVSLSDDSLPLEVSHTARMLGRLYDAVECQGMDGAVVQQVADGAGIPVYDGIASPGHPIERLADQLGAEASPSDNRRFMLQALLLRTIA
ncbi:MAG: ornithine carbamoyltransferase [Rubrivivax sp.]